VSSHFQMIKDKKIAMIAGASSAISYKRIRPTAETEEVIRHVIKDIDTRGENKIFGIAGASFVLKQIEKNHLISEREVIQNLTNETQNIIRSIEESDI
jgi:hypothetical protein